MFLVAYTGIYQGGPAPFMLHAEIYKDGRKTLTPLG
jgi:hypothetical protein